MKTAILGALIGTGLFIGGFVYHDQDYRGNPDTDLGLTYAITNDGTFVGYDTDSKENGAYVVGMVGAAILTASLKHAWNQHSDKKSTNPYGKFRATLDFLVSSGCLISGANLHDHQWESDGYVGRRLGDGTWIAFEPELRKNNEEHLGFALGTIGAVWFGATVKHGWDTRKTSDNLDRAYRELRLKLLGRSQGVSGHSSH